MTTVTDIQAKVAKTVTNMDRFDQFLNGGPGTVSTDQGLVQTLQSLIQQALAAASNFNPRGAWASGTAYALKDVVLVSGLLYVTTQAHTSGSSFTTDMNAGKWAVFQGAVPLTYPSAYSGHSVADMVAPGGQGFIDNVLSIQNKSTDGTNYGNAAIRFLDLAGTERAALGYSRNNAIQPNGYLPNLFYLEVGNAFTTDAQTTDFAIVTTLKGGGPEAPGSTVQTRLLDYVHASAAWTFRAHKLPASLNVLMDFVVGSKGGPYQSTFWGSGTTALRVREAYSADMFFMATNVTNLASGAAPTYDDSAKSAWLVGVGAGQDQFIIRSAAASATDFSDHLRIYRSGTDINIALLPTGNGRVALGIPYKTITSPVIGGYYEIPDVSGIVRKVAVLN